MKFKFPFEAVMKERRIRRDQAERDYRASQAKVDEQKGILGSMKGSLGEALDGVQQVRSGGGKLGSALKSYQEFIEGQKIRIQRQIKTIKGLEEIADEKRNILVEVAKDLKILEKLKEKKYNQFKVEMRKKEMKFIDEISITRAARGRFE